MIKKDTFIKIINSIKNEIKFQDELNDLFQEFCDEFLFTNFNLIHTITDVLEEIMKDNKDILSKAIYDSNMLQDSEKYGPKDNNGNTINNWEQLYDYLVCNKDEDNDMISKEVFLNLIKAIEHEQKFQNGFNILLEDYCQDSVFMNHNLESVILDVLEEIFNDKGEWLSYCFYDLDMLKEYKTGSCTYDNGENIDISTWSKLYDFLLENMKTTNESNLSV